ncbi:MAG: zinc-binding dehydrogenase, partial [Catenulispora sp.]
FAVQIARAAGATVLATAGPANQETLKDLGVHVPIDYRSQDPFAIALAETGGRGVDAVFDTVGGELIARSLSVTRPFGRLACILNPRGDLSPIYPRNLTLYGVILTHERARLDEMRRLIERGLMKPLVDEVLPLEDVHQAHERLETGHGRGKIVLRVAEEP